MPREFFLDSVEGGKAITVDSTSNIFFGRDEAECKVAFPESGTISRKHCKLFCFGDDVMVLDLSSNGTFVNSKQVGKGNQRVLRHGDILSIVSPAAPESAKFAWKVRMPTVTDVADSKSGVREQYDIGAKLGAGNFATVFKGLHRKTGAPVAVKIVYKKQFAMSGNFSYDGLFKEVDVLRNMNHRNIVRIYDSFDDPKEFTMVLELVKGGDFFDYIVGRCPSPFTEDEARALFVQLVEAVLYMHSKGVVHRDLKPENILVSVDDNFNVPHRTGDAATDAPNIPPSKVSLKITDFGLAKFCKEHEVMTTMCGTPAYLAPEVMHPSKAQGASGYGRKVDVWSLGVILYILLSGAQPENLHSGLKFHPSMKISDDARSLISGMLRLDVAARLDTIDICNHEWLASVHIEGRELAKAPAKPTMQATMIASASPPTNVNPPAVKQSRDATTSDAVDGELKKLRSETSKVVYWFWKKDLSLQDSDPNAWQKYSDDDSNRIQKAKEKGQHTSKVGTTGVYRISFEGMFQYSTAEPTKQRPVKSEQF